MIVGIGTDIVNLERIEKLLDDKFTTRCFTKAEQDYAEKKRPGDGHVGAYARRFAAKEACSKALGTGIGAHGALTDIEVIHDENGKPEVLLHGPARKRLETLTPEGKKAFIHLSLTDEPPLAMAFVIIEIT